MENIMKKRIIYTVLVLVVVFGAIFGWHFFVKYETSKYMAHYKFPPSSVSFTKTKTTEWRPFLDSTGTLVATQGVNVNPQISGTITSINFKSGQTVKKGDVLVVLDTHILEAQLQNSIARLKLSEITYMRDEKLIASHAISASQLDIARATLAQDKATVAQNTATLAQKTVRAPFAGKLGIRQVNVGQFLSAGTTITNLQKLNPLYADFNIPEQNISELHTGQTIEFTISAYPKHTFKGTIMAIDAQVDSDTKSVGIRAVVDNSDATHKLYPGMFVNVHVLLKADKGLVVIPITAINYTLYGDSVFVVESKTDKKGTVEKTAKLTYVTLGTQRYDDVSVLKGLKAGELIVSAGQLKLHDGSVVVIRNAAGQPTGKTASTQKKGKA
jgi:membrane fusion protein (multidrug efflux system)